MKKVFFIGLAVILSTVVGYYLMTQLKSKPVNIKGKGFSIIADIPPSFKHAQSGSDITITKSYGIEITVTKEVDDFKDYKLGETTGFRMGKMKMKNLDDLIERNTKSGDKLVSKETFNNGFGARFTDTKGKKYFMYVIKSGDSSFICRNSYYNMEDDGEMINICKTIR